MPKMSKHEKEEFAFFINENGRICYNEICKQCVRTCKQSFRAKLIVCNKYSSKRSNCCEGGLQS